VYVTSDEKYRVTSDEINSFTSERLAVNNSISRSGVSNGYS
jgi:hypothetical protein